jgi:hypothetical protein
LRASRCSITREEVLDPAFQRDVATRVAKLDAASGAEGDDARKLLKLLDRIGQAWPGASLDVGALHGHPVVVSFFPSPWSDREPREAAALVSLAKEFGSDEGGLEFVVVHTLYSQDDEADRRKHLDCPPARPLRLHAHDLAPGYRWTPAEIPDFVLPLDRGGRLSPRARGGVAASGARGSSRRRGSGGRSGAPRRYRRCSGWRAR